MYVTLLHLLDNMLEPADLKAFMWRYKYDDLRKLYGGCDHLLYSCQRSCHRSAGSPCSCGATLILPLVITYATSSSSSASSSAVPFRIQKRQP